MIAASAFFLLCLVSGVFRCVWFAIPDAVFAQGYRPENRRPTAVGSTPFLLNALQFALYSLPNVLYFYSYALLICFWGSLLHVLFSQRPTTTGGGGGAAAQTASADSSRLIAYKPAARFFRFSVIGVALLQVGLFVSIFFVDFFTVVIANCMFVSALALFSIIAYAIHAVAVYRKLRPVYQHVLRARQWGSDSGGAVWPHSDMSMGLAYEQQAALLAASSSSAAASRAGGRSPLFETDEHSEWSIDARPRAKKGALLDRLADREDWRDYSGSGDAVGIPHRSSSSHSHSHNSSGGRYSPRNLSTTAPSMPPSLALLHAQHQTALHTPGASGGMMMLNHSMVSAGSSGGGGGGMREISRSLTQTTPSQSGRGSAMAPVSTSADELSYAPGPEEGDDEDDEEEEEENSSRSHSGSDSRSRSRSRGSCSDASDTERGLASAPHEIDLSSSSSMSERSGVASPGLLLPPGTEDPYASPGPHVLPPMPAHAHMQSASPSPRYPPPQLLLLPAPVARTSKHSSFSPSPARSSASNSGGSSPGLGLGPGSGANGEHVVREEDFYAPPRSPSATPPRRKGSPFNAQQLQQQQYIAAPLSRAASPDYVAVTLTAEGLATRPPAAATGWGGIAGGVGVAGGTTRPAAPSLYSPRAASYATFSPAAVPVALAGAPSSDLDGSAEEALALYAYRQTRKILLLTVCVGLCSGARIASSLIELHYTWLQVHQDNGTSPDDQHANESAFPEQWFIFVDGQLFFFSSSICMHVYEGRAAVHFLLLFDRLLTTVMWLAPCVLCTALCRPCALRLDTHKSTTCCSSSFRPPSSCGC